MATIGKINFKLIATTGQFQKGMRRAGKQIGRFADRVKSSVRGMLNFRTAIATLAGSAGLGLLIKRTIDQVDLLSKTSTKLGVTAAALAKLQFAAKLTGVETRQLNMGLQRMIRRIAEAAKGTGEAKDALKQLGIDAVRVSLLSADEQFLAVARAMEKVQKQSERVRLSFKLFDSEGVSLVNTLAEGEAGLKKIFAEAGRFGTALDDISAAKIVMAKDAITRAQEAFAGLRIALTTSLAPVVVAMFNATAELGIKWQDVGRVATASMRAMVIAAGDVVSGVKRMGLALTKLAVGAKAIELGGKSLFILPDLFLGKRSRFAEAHAGLQGLLRGVRELEKELGASTTIGDQWGVAFDAAMRKAEEAANRVAERMKLNFGADGGILKGIKSAADSMRTGRIGFKTGKEIAFGGFNESRRLVAVQESALDVLKRIERKVGGAALA